MRRGGRLVVSLRSEPKSFNPVTALDQPSKTLFGLLMADLLRIDRADQQVRPHLAESWTVSPDGKTYALTLREGVRFSDGHPLDVDDILFTFRVHLDEKVHSPQRDLLIVGGEPIAIRAAGTRRVELTLKEPYAAGARLFDSFYILPEHLLADDYAAGELDTVWGLLDEPSSVVGLGAFRLKEIVAGERLVLERNPHYFRTDGDGVRLPYLDEIWILVIPAEETAALKFRSGELHLIEDLDPTRFARLETMNGLSLQDLGPGLEYNFLFFNLNDRTDGTIRDKQAWFRSTEFRRAVAAAIDTDAIARLVYHGRASTLATHVTPGNRYWFDDSLPAEAQDLAASRERFRAAGFEWDAEGWLVDVGGQRVTISLLTNAGNERRARMAALIQEDLRRVGIRVTIASLEFRSYVDRMFTTRDYDAALLGLVGGDADPNPEMSLLLSDGGMHVWSLGHNEGATEWQEEIDSLMKEQLTTLDVVRRKALYDRVQRLVYDHRPFIPLVSPNILVGAAKEVRQFRPGVLPSYTLWNADELYLAPAGR